MKHRQLKIYELITIQKQNHMELTVNGGQQVQTSNCIKGLKNWIMQNTLKDTYINDKR
jgi:hypothetical protein